MEGFAYEPASISVPAGTTVVWSNNDIVPHTVTARDGLFDSGSISRNDTFSYTFEQPGVIDYYCKFHPNMTGVVTVE